MDSTFQGLSLPDVCPACGAGAVWEKRVFAADPRPPQLTRQYACEVILAAGFRDNSRAETMVNVSAGCRLAVDRALHPNAPR